MCPSVPFTLYLQYFHNEDQNFLNIGLTYQWQYSPDGSAWSNISAATAKSVQLTQSSDTWYRCLVTCSASGNTGISTPIQIVMNSPAICYCVGTYYFCGNGDGIDITNMTFGNIDNNRTPVCNLPDNYTDYSYLSTTVYSGLSYPISISSGADKYPIYWGIWVDWNNSGSFTDDLGKYTVIHNDQDTSVIGTGTIVVPDWATLGNHLMRIRTNWNADPQQAGACEFFDEGEQEDYTVNVGLMSCSGTPNPGNTVSNNYSVCPNDTFILSLQNYVTLGTGVSYQWQSSPDNSTWSNISDATTNYELITQNSATWYSCAVTCSANTGISTPLQVLMNSPTTCYCSGTYYFCGSDYGIDITNVTFGDINNSTIAYCNPPSNYNDYTYLSTGVTQGGYYPISISSDSASYYVYWGIWVDWNNSGSFTDNADKYTVINNIIGNTTTGSGTITVPAYATQGNHRMRIRASYYDPAV